MKSITPMSRDPQFALNAVCPYFTMFPLEYPMRVLDPRRLRSFRRPILWDPYCGRGTALFAARLRRIRAYGSDVSPVAIAIAQAKLVMSSKRNVLRLARRLLRDQRRVRLPKGEFWQRAYHRDTLRQICRLRAGLRSARISPAAVTLRAILLGALHGPKAKDEKKSSYFSNQMPRTFAAKPDYAVRFWRARRLKPPRIDVLDVVSRRLDRVLAKQLPTSKTGPHAVLNVDSREAKAFAAVRGRITHVVTSPPYYGLRTYHQDQWLREWFLGGSASVDYLQSAGLDHASPKVFAESLAKVWDRVGAHASPRIRMYVRFGSIRSRAAPADDILRASLEESAFAWTILTRHDASSADAGKRQARQMGTDDSPATEFDYVIALRSTPGLAIKSNGYG